MGASTTVTPARVRDVLPGWGVTQERVDEAVRNIVTAYNPLRVVASVPGRAVRLDLTATWI